jgi:hypothetical protein
MLNRCTRFHADGTPCPNWTRNADAWCRQDDCDGYVRPSLGHSEPPVNHPPSQNATPWVRPAEKIGLEPDEAYEVSVTRTAIAAYVAMHGGSEEAAEAQIRVLLEDALRTGKARRRAPRMKYWHIERRGFSLMLSAELDTVTHYSTHHRDRTYAQVAAQVPSRAPARVLRRPGVGMYEDGPAVPVSEAQQRVDPYGVLLTGRARTTFEAACPELRATPDDVFDKVLRDAFAADLAGPVTITVRESGLYAMVGASGWTWIVGPGLVALAGVKKPPAQPTGD